MVAFLGLWASYFVSFIVGSPLATIIGTVRCRFPPYTRTAAHIPPHWTPGCRHGAERATCADCRDVLRLPAPQGFAFNSLLRPYLLAYQRAVKVRGYDPEVPHIAGLFSA